MKLVVSDRFIDLGAEAPEDVGFIDLSALRISNCVGCFGCWTKTPGRCVIRDDAVKVYPRIAASRRLMYVSRVTYGGYDTVMKTMLERAIPIQKAFIRIHNGETHHVQRAVEPKKAVIVGYGDIADEEREVFCRLVARNANNMNFENFKIIFAAEQDLERTVRDEVRAWEKS